MSAPLLVAIGEGLGLVNGTGAGGLEYGTQAEISFGGDAGNVTICASRLGARAAWVGRLGDDPFGNRIVRTLRGEGVEVSATLDRQYFTGMLLKERVGDGMTRVSYLREGGAGSRITPADLPHEVLAQAAVLHVTGISAGLSETSLETIVAAVRIAKDAGALISFDVNHRSKIWSTEAAAPIYRELAVSADILFAGVEEAEIVVGTGTPAEQATRLAELGPSQVLVKLGEEGALALVDGVFYKQAAFPVRAVDTVGAGDAFVAGYLTELMAGEPVQVRMRTGAASGAFACLRSGDWESMPSREQLRSLLDQSDPVDR